MSASAEAIAPQTPASLLDAFRGKITPTRLSPLYSAGVAVVALAMVLLPLIYVGIVLLTAAAVLFHLAGDIWLLASPGGIIVRLILYVGPAVAGGILVFFMVKPFFAAKQKSPDPITLDPASEPLLFAFVQKICVLVRAPPPCRIDVDCQANASASLRRGFRSKDLVLTIGLPLAGGLDMRQFAGVLAHEFGHFAQGAGMRLTYVIRRINLWFARVVYERDAWDVKLDRSAQRVDWRIAVILHLARGCVWLTRRLLWALMQAGHALSCFMLRQMEYDADSYGAKVAGSDTFEQIAARLRVLNVATQTAYGDVRQSWASNRLPENLPLLINHKAGSLSPEIVQNLSAGAAAEKTRWFDTHPSEADRRNAVRRLNEPGVFRLAAPAPDLFSDFAALSRAVTRHQYEKHLGLRITDQNLMPADEILRESAANAQSEALLRKFYGAVNCGLAPLLLSGELPSVTDPREARTRWLQARKATDQLRPEAEKYAAEYLAHQNRVVALTPAQWLCRAGFKLQPKEFGLPESAVTVDQQILAVRQALEQTAAAKALGLTRLDPFLAGLRERVTLALSLAAASADRGAGTSADKARELVRLLAAVDAEMPRVHDLGTKLNTLPLLMQNRVNHSDPARVDRLAGELAGHLQAVVNGFQERLKGFAYPFPHARGSLTAAEYARYEHPAASALERAYLDAKSHVERLFALHYRLIGQFLLLANAAEAELEKNVQVL